MMGRHHAISPDYSQLIGKPYSEMNCWDATRQFYALCFGVELKHYCTEAPDHREDIRSLIYSSMGDFVEIDFHLGMKFGDLVLFKIRGIESHIGVYTETGRFFHSSKTTGSVIDRMEKWKHLVVGVYRLKCEAA